ncbi:hypothetical protein E8M24_27925 [Bacillus thuringiensis]|uniref:Uncharacterized protein n=2 Tax=Bacillus cereus group TaxID=86661 RepID=A0AAW4R4W8_BACCE|nr:MULTISPECIES: hypothetical protein [Bacillus cereus group]KAB5632721.1 hypothetical protein E8M24_27925 [Bacillus thuringiensis]MBY0041063.1 hypothetical protein [Bacillus cereus]MEC2872659.1 hypothetical protein [Bacillus cereus]OTZ72749.1 hypothetical protein BK769_15445 [Bacillus thuringiensis serovar kumamtoensis]HDR5271734.1 hypothetical protein [Bacillus thuringiensis]
MSQANIPNITPTISITVGQTVPLLLASIALEELALAHVINSEAEKIQFILGTLNTSVTPPPITLSGLLTVNDSVQKTLQAAIKKEMLLQFKLENVLDLISITPL